MPNHNNNNGAEMVTYVSDLTSATVLNLNVQTLSTSTEGIVFYMSREGIYDYMNSVISKEAFEMKKEQLYLTAIRNLIKKIEIFNLQDRLDRKVITKRQFNKEIEKDPSKYIIDTFYVTDSPTVEIASCIISDLNVELTIDDAAEMFSFEANSFSAGLSNLLI